MKIWHVSRGRVKPSVSQLGKKLAEVFRLALILACVGSCQSKQTVTGVWREVPINAEGDIDREITLTNTAAEGVLYELNLGQYGDRVAGVSVRYRIPQSNELASFDRGDRCGCTFIVQGLIETLEDSEEDTLLFEAQGLTFSLYDPEQEFENVSVEECLEVPSECRRVFDLELVEGGDVLVGETWCLNINPIMNEQNVKRPVRFEPISGIPEDICEHQARQ